MTIKVVLKLQKKNFTTRTQYFQIVYQDLLVSKISLGFLYKKVKLIYVKTYPVDGSCLY